MAPPPAGPNDSGPTNGHGKRLKRNSDIEVLQLVRAVPPSHSRITSSKRRSFVPVLRCSGNSQPLQEKRRETLVKFAGKRSRDRSVSAIRLHNAGRNLFAMGVHTTITELGGIKRGVMRRRAAPAPGLLTSSRVLITSPTIQPSMRTPWKAGPRAHGYDQGPGADFARDHCHQSAIAEGFGTDGIDRLVVVPLHTGNCCSGKVINIDWLFSSTIMASTVRSSSPRS